MNAEPQPNKPGVLMPAPTAWPFAMAVGSALVFTGLLTNAAVSVLGAIFTLMGAVGWVRQVLPHETEELIPLQPEAAAPHPVARKVTRMELVEVHRAWLPLKIYPV